MHEPRERACGFQVFIQTGVGACQKRAREVFPVYGRERGDGFRLLVFPVHVRDLPLHAHHRKADGSHAARGHCRAEVHRFRHGERYDGEAAQSGKGEMNEKACCLLFVHRNDQKGGGTAHPGSRRGHL